MLGTTRALRKYDGMRDGAMVAANRNDLLDASLAVAIDRDEYGNLVSNRDVWTNTLPDGSLYYNTAGSTCSDWTDSSGAILAVVGSTSTNSSGWTWNAQLNCGGAASL